MSLADLKASRSLEAHRRPAWHNKERLAPHAEDMFPHTVHCEMILLLERSSKEGPGGRAPWCEEMCERERGCGVGPPCTSYLVERARERERETYIYIYLFIYLFIYLLMMIIIIVITTIITVIIR